MKQNRPNRKFRPIVLRPVELSNALELSLLHALTVLVRTIYREAREYVVPVAAEERRQYHADDVGQNARSIIEALRQRASQAEATASVAASDAIRAEGKRHTGRWTATVASQAQIDIRALLSDDDLVNVLSMRSEEFNRLITSLSTEALDRIERQTLGAIFEGRSNADIAKALQEAEGLSRNRARLIARDQASKLNSAMNQFRQQQAGITHYKWRTILDGRERPSHHANNRKVFAWARPPTQTGHPGHDINCRCRALAILSDEDPEIGEQPLPAELEAEGVEANEQLLKRVGSTPTKNVFGWSPDQILTRQSELASAREVVGRQRATREFTEADAEALATLVYGFLPTNDTLTGLYGSRAMAQIVKRRTLLFHAVAERFELIERLLAQAEAQHSN